jgi:hypothetical protein
MPETQKSEPEIENGFLRIPLTPELLGQLETIKATREDKLTELRAQGVIEGTKGLLLINGGGAVALAAFLQAVWDKAFALRPWLLWAIAVLTAGVAFASATFFARYLHGLSPKSVKPFQSAWWWVSVALMAGAVLAFVVGMCLAVVGGFVAHAK